jgi:hypothetical protein
LRLFFCCAGFVPGFVCYLSIITGLTITLMLLAFWKKVRLLGPSRFAPSHVIALPALRLF